MKPLPLLSVPEAIACWDEYASLLEVVIAEDRLNSMTLEYAHAAVKAGKLRILYDGNTVISFAILEGICHLIHGFGELEAIQATLPEVERFASLSGASRIRISGRTGWCRVLSGYTVLTTVLEKVL